MVFVTKLENGNKINDGLCLRCAKELGLPVDNMLGNVMNQYGISADDLEAMEDNLNNMMPAPSDNDDVEEGGAPAIDLPKLFEDAGLPSNTPELQNRTKKKNGDDSSKQKK